MHVDGNLDQTSSRESGTDVGRKERNDSGLNEKDDYSLFRLNNRCEKEFTPVVLS